MHQNDASGCPTDMYGRLAPGGARDDGHCGPTWTPPLSGAHLSVVGLPKGTELGQFERFVPDINTYMWF
jgi:hypothetical protein